MASERPAASSMVSPVVLALCCLAAQAVALRYWRWLTIERAIVLGDAGIEMLAAHRGLVRGILFGVLALGILLSRYWMASPQRHLAASHRASLGVWLLQWLAFGSLVLMLGVLPTEAMQQALASMGPDRVWLEAGIYLLIALVWLSLIALGALLLVPYAFWRRFVAECKAGLLAVWVGVLAYVLSQALLSQFEMLWTNIFLLPTIRLAEVMGKGLGLDVSPLLSAPLFGTPGFVVDIGPTCLGYQGVSIVLLVMLSHFYVQRDRLRFPNVLSMIPVSVLILLFFNALRIVTLVAIGAHWSPSVALLGFHSTSGWVELILTITGTLYVISRSPWFRKKAKDLSPIRLEGHEFWVLPQAILVGTAFLTQLLTGHFHWAYPVQIAAAAAFMWHFRKRLPSLKGTELLWPVFAGVGVAVLWVLWIPLDVQANQAFALHLFSVPTEFSVLWLLSRFIGAALIVPIVEEFAFRGFLWSWVLKSAEPWLSPRLATWAAWLLSSVVFGLFHSHLEVAILAGLCLGGVYLRRLSLGDAILAHASANAALGLYVVVSGNWAYW